MGQRDLTSTHQATISDTIRKFTASGDFPSTTFNIVPITTNNPGRPIFLHFLSCRDHAMALLVSWSLPSYILQIPNMRFKFINFSQIHQLFWHPQIHFLHGRQILIHCYPTPNCSLDVLKLSFDKSPNKRPFHAAFDILAELVLTLNNFSFHGGHYQQTSSIAKGTITGPKYTNLYLVSSKQTFSSTLTPYLIALVSTLMTVFVQQHVLVLK